jgi:siroheme synthase (precorrin-2 oxidase/ferrochelatase)
VIVAVGTSGALPSLARAVRKLIEEALPEGIGPLAEALGHARPALLARYPAFAERAAKLEQFVMGAIERVRNAGVKREDAARWVRDALLEPDGGRQLAGAADARKS